MFTRLRTKLTLLFAALFGVVLVLVSLAVYGAVSTNARHQVRQELVASGTVFDRIWALRSDQLRQGAVLLSKDFGFREAMATQDKPTVISAMENLRARLNLDLAFIVDLDGQITAVDESRFSRNTDALLDALYDAEEPAGVATIDGVPHQVIAAPILSPNLMGWVVFAKRLDRAEMQALEKLAAIPLSASVLNRTAAGWVSQGKAQGRAVEARFVSETLASGSSAPAILQTAQGPSIALVKPLPSLLGSSRSALLLRYPLAKAMEPYRPILVAVVLTGLAGMALVAGGSWVLARSLTRPIAALDKAVRRLQSGEDAHVEVQTHDEIGRLAESFNVMATEIRDRERRITHLAMHDAVTGLPNRLALERVADADRTPAGLIVAATGIDRYDAIRGAIGNDLAARLLAVVGERIGASPIGATVARLDTDVLGFVFPAASEAEAETMVANMIASLEGAADIDGAAVDVSVTVGLARLAAAEAAVEAVERANIALDQARAGHRKIAIFDAEAYGDPSANLALMSELLGGLEAGEVTLFYQPKYDMRRQTVSGVEALMRWRHPLRGMVSPDLFITMAEETGHIRALTDWALARVVRDQASLAELGHAVEMSVNISGRLLGDPDFAAVAHAAAKRATGRLCFEITETAVIQNPDAALEMLDGFAEAGIAISIDDFGSGLSSLAYLKQIKGQELKVDKSLVTGVADSQRDALIVRSTVDLAHSLGMKVTAEGVETNAMYAVLAAMGCDTVQGYLVARPMALADLTTFLDNERAEARNYG